MIARRWRGLARSGEARNYVEHLRRYGADPERAVVPPNVVAMMVEYDERATHYAVVEGPV